MVAYLFPISLCELASDANAIPCTEHSLELQHRDTITVPTCGTSGERQDTLSDVYMYLQS